MPRVFIFKKKIGLQYVCFNRLYGAYALAQLIRTEIIRRHAGYRRSHLTHQRSLLVQRVRRQ